MQGVMRLLGMCEPEMLEGHSARCGLLLREAVPGARSVNELTEVGRIPGCEPSLSARLLYSAVQGASFDILTH